MKTSESLVVGDIYTRNRLREMFRIRDATINTGTFRPKGHDSMWLFVTEKKTSDRTQYYDRLDNDVLHWDGQTKTYLTSLRLLPRQGMKDILESFLDEAVRSE